jgi:magnesium-transporting ATPase (P-type)
MGSGQSVYLSWAITFYNMAFTFFPVVIRAVFETDIYIDAEKNDLKKLNKSSRDKEEIYKHYPKMYYTGQKNTIFNAETFFSWFLLGTLQGITCLIINIYGLTNVKTSSGYNSYQSGFYFMGISLVTSIVIVVNLKLALNVQEWNLLLIIAFTVPTIGVYFLYAYISNIWNISPIEGYTGNLLTMPYFILFNIVIFI